MKHQNLNPAESALIVVDVQKAFDQWEADGRRRNNPLAEQQIAELLALFRERGAHVIHIRHASLLPDSKLRAELPGHAVKDEAREMPGEPVLVKHVNSSFIGTDLEERLRSSQIRNLVVVGATTNHCVETTTRMAGNLGFDAYLVSDATWTFDLTGPDGVTHPADKVHEMTLANLSGEFAEIVTTAEVSQRLS
jgi:nicotinamidase-related amidase